MTLVDFSQSVFGMRVVSLAWFVDAGGPDRPVDSAFVAVEEGLRFPDDAADVDAVPFLLRRLRIL
jgi:hypothetical protein